MLCTILNMCRQRITVASQVRYHVPLTVARQVKIDQGNMRSFSISNKVHQKNIHSDGSNLASKTPILDQFSLTSNEAFHYLRHTLGIDSAETKLRRDRFGLLREITLQSHLRVPFQNVTNTCAIPESEKRIPSFDEIKLGMLTGQGGFCYDLNIFMNMMNRVLHALGYNVHLIGGTFMGHDRYHVTNVVHDVEVKGQRHLVEVGACDPTFYPVPLDFRKEGPTYQDSFLTHRYKLSLHGDYLQRWHILDDSNTDNALLDDQAQDTKWRLISELNIDTYRDVDYFTETMSYVVEALPRPNLKMLMNLGMIAIIYKNGKMIFICDNHCYLETNQDTVEHRVMTSMEDVLDTYSKYMPMIPHAKVLLGLTSRNVVFPNKDEISNPVSVRPIIRCKDVFISFNPIASGSS